MPIYDYVCANCAHELEAVHGVHDAGPTVCTECGGLLRKRLSTPAIHFRGSGWAKKDARAAARGKGGKHGSSASGGEGSEKGPGHGRSAEQGDGPSVTPGAEG